MRNPFDIPTTIRDPQMLLGRDEELKRIFDLIKSQQSVSLVGRRRIGKSSLLRALKDKKTQERIGFPSKDFVFFFISLQGLSKNTEKTFLDDVNALMRREAQVYLKDVLPEEDDGDEFINLIQELTAQGLHPILIIDGFDKIVRYQRTEALFGFLRSQGTMGLVSYITASLQTLGKICLTDDGFESPLVNIFKTIQLGSIKKKDARELLLVFSTKEGLAFSEEEISWVLEIAGCHPYLLFQVAAALFNEKGRSGVEKVHLGIAKEEAYQNLADYFRDAWTILNKNEQKQLIEEIAQQNQEDIKYPELSASKLFHEYLEKQGIYKPEEIPLKDEEIMEELKKVLDNLSDIKVVGESILARHQVFAARIPADKVKESTTCGKFMSETLKEAFGKMSGPGLRNDTAPAWQYYNILYYCYFSERRKHITNKQIAARLALSERQYYRERTEAIETLWEILLEMSENREPIASIPVSNHVTGG